MSNAEGKSSFVYVTYIRTTPERVWDAITDPEWSQRFGYGLRDVYELHPGGRYRGFGNACPFTTVRLLKKVFALNCSCRLK